MGNVFDAIGSGISNAVGWVGDNIGGIAGGILNPVGTLANGLTGGLLGGGGGSSFSAPPGMSADDFIRIANQEAAQQQALLAAQTQANRPNQYTPFGNVTWSNNGGNWTQRLTLPPAMQATLDAQNALALNRTNTARGLMPAVQSTLKQKIGGNLPGISANPTVQSLQSNVDMSQLPNLTNLQAYIPGLQQGVYAGNVTPSQAQVQGFLNGITGLLGGGGGGAQPQQPAPQQPAQTGMQVVNGTTYVPGYGTFTGKLGANGLPSWLRYDAATGKLHNMNAADPSREWKPPSDWRGSPGVYGFQPGTGQAPGQPASPTQTPASPSGPSQEQIAQWVQQVLGSGLLGGGSSSPAQANRNVRSTAEEALYQQAASRLDPQWNAQYENLRTQLYSQGLRPGMPAYDKAVGQFQLGKTDAYNQAIYSAITGGGAEAERQFGMDLAASNFANQAALQGYGMQQGAASQTLANRGQQYGELLGNANLYNQAALSTFDMQSALKQLTMQQRNQLLNEDLQKRLQSINELNALQTGQQVGQPSQLSFVPAGQGQAANLLGAYTSGIQAQLGAQSLKNAGQASMLGGITSLLPLLLAA